MIVYAHGFLTVNTFIAALLSANPIHIRFVAMFPGYRKTIMAAFNHAP
jgi:hypothetical protein